MAHREKITCPVCGCKNRANSIVCNLCKAILVEDKKVTLPPLPLNAPALKSEWTPVSSSERGAPIIMKSFHQQQAENRRNSVFLITIMVSTLIILGGVVGAQFNNVYGGAVIALIFATIYGLFAWFAGASTLLALSGANKASRNKYPQLFNIVEEMKIAAGVPMPEVYVIDSPAPNAFATGRDHDNSAVAVTTGLLDKLNRDELQGVIAHEMGHIKNFDIRYAMLAAILVGVVVMISDGVTRVRYMPTKGKNNGAALILIIALIFAILSPIFTKLLQMAISRQREFLADATAVQLTRNPNGLAKALAKIARDPAPLRNANQATQSLYIVNPFKNFKMDAASLFSTHPATEARINALHAMGASVTA